VAAIPMEDLLNNIPLFSDLKEVERKTLSERLVVRSFPKNSIVIVDGDVSDSLYLIISGRVKVFLTDDAGKEVILNYQSKGEFFGEVALLDDQPRSASVIALEPCKFAILSKSDFCACLAEHPDIAMSIILKLSNRLRVLTEKVRSLALMDVYGRLKQTLLDLSEEQEGQRVVTERLTQQELANMVGASREMVTRILKDLTKGGYIDIEDKRITIKEKLPSAW
jgi:CRP/FNR family cyclic AMP-dependent transcriptional regulator